MSAVLSDLSAMVDDFHSTRAARLEADREAAKLKEREVALSNALIAILRNDGVGSVGGRLCRVTLQRKDIPIVNDWSLVYQFIKAHDAYDLLQKRLHEGAFDLRWQEGITVPGTEQLPKFTLSVSKL